MNRFSKMLVCGVSSVAFGYVFCSVMVFEGPFHNVRSYLVDSIATTRHGYLLKPLSLYMISNKEITSNGFNFEEKAEPTMAVNLASMKDYNVNDDTITVDTINNKRFSAKVVQIKDPKRIQLAVTKHLGSVGESVSDFVKDTHAVAGFNGGEFLDKSSQGTGGMPIGITISDGKVIGTPPSGPSPIIGFTRGGELVVGSFTLSQLQSMDVSEAVTFGPALIEDGQTLDVPSEGYAPRTAIGQKDDGTVVVIATDGRQRHGMDDVGATMQDLQDIFLQYGVKTAANLDGGSSMTMIFHNQPLVDTSDILGERKIATAFVVLPEGKNN